METLSDLAAGKAGEYLVCADLILAGHTAFLSEQGLPFDVVADVNGRLLRVQVKTTRAVRKVPQRIERHDAYLFHVTRCGKGGLQAYGASDVDMFAFVALDSREIGYLPASLARQTMMFRSGKLRGQYHDEVMAERTVKIKAMRTDGMTLGQICAETGLDKSYVSRVCLGKSGVTQTTDTYLPDMTSAKAIAAL